MKSILNENEKQKLLKLIFWDKTGFWLAQKRLERNTWPWPDLLIEKMKGKLSEKDHYPNIRISCRADRSTVYAARKELHVLRQWRRCQKQLLDSYHD